MERIEYDMDEQDEAWLSILNQQLRNKKDGRCTLDFFELIMDRLEKLWFELTKDMPKSSRDDVPYPDDINCCICDDGEVENSNGIVFCDGCNIAVHQDCYGVPFIPEGQWLCRKCLVSPESPVSCVLCPVKDGAFKQTRSNKWAHLLCALWIPECSISNTVFMEPIDGVEAIPKTRWKLVTWVFT